MTRIQRFVSWSSRWVLPILWLASWSPMPGLGAVPDDVNWQAMSAQLPGVDGRISAFAASGGRLYAGGRFRIIGGLVTSGVASWDGTRWSPLGSGVNGGVSALLVRGAEVIAAGDFSNASGVAALQVARWDGSKWNAMGALATRPSGEALALAEFNGEIYAGGNFQTANGAAGNHIARWNGSQWLPVGGGVDDIVYALHVFDGALFVGGAFRNAGGQPMNGIARWTGSEWKPVEQGVRGGQKAVYALGSVSTNLYVGGDFGEVGGEPWMTALGLARVSYSGEKPRWRSLNVQLVSVRALRGFEDRLFVGGRFGGIGQATSRNVAELPAGTNWISFGSGVSAGNLSDVAAIEPFGGQIFCGGFFETAGDQRIPGIARWTGSAWQSAGGGTDLGLNQGSQRVRVVGGRVYVLGTFRGAGSTPVAGAAEWTGAGWVAMGGGVPQWTQFQQARVTTDGRDLFVAMAGGGATRLMHRWDGAAWSPVGDAGPQGALAILSSNVCAVGNFSHGFGVARLEGNQWRPLGGALTVGNPIAFGGNGHLVASGTNLYVGGAFTAIGGEPIQSVARWDGVKWQSLGAGWPGTASGFGVGALAGAANERLYVGPASNVRSNSISVWDGAAWSMLPGVFSADGSGVFIYSIIPDGTDLWVGGRFDRVDDVPASNIARWDGVRWHGLGSGLSGANAIVFDLAVADDRLYAAGSFTTAGAQGSRYFAIWHKAKVDPLSVSFDLPVDRVGIGQAFDLKIDLRNSSFERMTGVELVPPSLRTTGGAQARLLVSPYPPVDLPGRSGVVVTYNYQATHPGRMAFHAGAQGRRPDGSQVSAVEANSRPVLISPGDLTVKRGDQAPADYAGRDIYQASALKPQIKTDYVTRGQKAVLHVRVHNRDSRDQEFVLMAAVRGKTNWVRTYRMEGGADLTPVIETPTGAGLAFDPASARTIEVGVEPAGEAPGDFQRIEFTLRPAADPATVLDAVEVVVESVNELLVNSTGDEADADLTDDLPDVDKKKPGLQTTLRCAIDFANRSVGRDLIKFDIPAADPGWLNGLPWIRPASPLPHINAPLTLDATTHPGTGRVALDGAAAGVADGLRVVASHCVVRGMVITGFQGAGIMVDGAESTELTHGMMGAAPAQHTGTGNGVGIRLRGAREAILGGRTFESRNVIAGNATHGVHVVDSENVEARVNFVGTTPDGNGSLPNRGVGLLAERSKNVLVGLRDHFSIFSGSTAVRLSGVSGNGGDGSGGGSGGGLGSIVLANCRIGLNAAGTSALGATMDGVVLEDCSGLAIGSGGSGGGNDSSDAAAMRNLFSGITSNAIRLLRSTNIWVGANYVGTDMSGNQSLAVGTGIAAEHVRGLTIGSSTALSVFNAQTGIVLRDVSAGGDGGGSGGASDTENRLLNCYLGLKALGTAAFGTMVHGLIVEDSTHIAVGLHGSAGGGGGGSSEIEAARNLFAGIRSNAMQFVRSKNVRVGANHVGTDRSGNVSLRVGVGINADRVEHLTIGHLAASSCYEAEVPIKLHLVSSGSSGGGGGSGSGGPSRMVNCLIGLAANGTAAFGSAIHGVILEDCSDFAIGGGGTGSGADSSEDAAARNFFSGIASNAMWFLRSTNLHVGANYVGTDRSGEVSLAVGTGIVAEQVRNLSIGLTNALSLFNGRTGVVLRGVSDGGSGGGGGSGSDFGTRLVRCYFGLKARGTAAFEDMIHGLIVENSTNIQVGFGGSGGGSDSSQAAAARNIFAGVRSNAMSFLRCANVRVGANHIGTDASGNASAAVGVGIRGDEVRDLFIGSIGSMAAVSALNAKHAGALLRRVSTSAGANVASGMVNVHLGVRADGGGGFGSGGKGVELDDCEDVQLGGPGGAGSGNFYGGLSDGIEIRNSRRIRVQNSKLGVDREKPTSPPIPSTGAGIVISGKNQDITIGGVGAREGNVIAHFGREGIRMAATGSNVTFQGNLIFRTLKPIARVLDGAHFPKITRAFRGSTHAEGTLSGRPGDVVRLEFFAHRPGLPTEAEMFLGAMNVMLNASGTAAYNAVFPLSAPSGWLLTSTASDSSAGTSEFSSSSAIGPAPDSDGDGLPDFWEARFPSCLNPAVPDPLQEDCDGDGFTNLQEYQANTDPTKADSFLRIEALTVTAGAGLTFQAATGRQYGLERSVEGAAGPWVRVVTVAPDVDGRITLNDTHPEPARGFYRIVAEFP